MIDIENVSKQFGAITAVDKLTLHVPAGELFCFLGPNGAGKTTTIKMLTGLLRPDSGTVRVGETDVQADPVGAKRLMGYIPDVPYMYDRLTPVEFVRFVGDLYNVAPDKTALAVGESLEAFGLGPYRNALIGDLSHGLRQRLIYVATFLHEPKVMLIDEPLVGLDPYTIRMIKDILTAKARAGMTIFLTTHILPLAEEIADRIGIIDKGRLIALGRLQDLVTQAGAGSGLEEVFLGLTAEAD